LLPLPPKIISPEALLAEAEDLIRTAPDAASMGKIENVDWVGRAGAVVEYAGKGAQWAVAASQLNSAYAGGPLNALTLLHQVRHELQLRTGGPLSVAFEHKSVFDYFDELRKVIVGAQLDLLFVDPYMDAEFASRYLPQVRATVPVRLLTSRRHVAALQQAVTLIKQQHGLSVEIRVNDSIHDRHLFVDRALCYQSGASFKDGAKRAPTTLQQITDVFPEVSAAYEAKWANGQPVAC
jgi:hypothetical protein